MTEENLLGNIEAEQEEKTVDQIEEEASQPKEILKPEGLDDSLWDAENKKVKESDLLEAYKKEQEKALGLRRKLSEKGNVKPPKSADEYLADESIAEILPNDSEGMKTLREKALEAGLSKDQFNDFVTKLIPALHEKGLIAKPDTTTDEEKQIRFEEYKKAELDKIGKDAPVVLQKLKNWGDGMVNKGILSRDELPVFEALASNAESVVVLNKIMSLTGEPSIPVKTAVVGGLPSRAEVDQLIASKEYEAGNADVHRKVKEYFEAVA